MKNKILSDPTVIRVVPTSHAKKPKAKVKRAVPKKVSPKPHYQDNGNREYNKEHYGKRIDQLKHIIEDKAYLKTEFLWSMYDALVNGRRISPKMESSITAIVKKYAKWRTLENDPKYRKKKTDYITSSNRKIENILSLLSECGYDEVYESRSEYFLQSVRKFLLETGKLSIKQRKALNSMYKRFEKRVKKVKKSEKKT